MQAFLITETGQHERPYQTAQQVAKVLNIPVAYLYCDGNNLAEILLQISSASDERIQEIKVALSDLVIPPIHKRS